MENLDIPIYVRQLKRLGNLIINQIVEERRRFVFIGGFDSSYEETAELMELNNHLDAQERNLNARNVSTVSIEMTILELKRILFNLRRLRYNFEEEREVYYEMELARLISLRTRDEGKYPEYTMMEDIKRLPDSTNTVGGKSKKKRKNNMKKTKKVKCN